MGSGLGVRVRVRVRVRVSVRGWVRVRVRVERKEMLSEMGSIFNRTGEKASSGGIFIIGIPYPVPFN